MFKRSLFIGSVFLSLINFSLPAENFPFTPPLSFTLTPEYIALHHPVTTDKIAAQLYFDQGLTLIYAFNHDAAYWSFLNASEIDPQMAMAYWGMALALGPNINMGITPEREKAAYQAIQKALNNANKASESEKDYIQALSVRYTNSPNPDHNQAAIQYSQNMRLLSQKYKDDHDASVLFAESLLDLNPWNQWSIDGKPLKGTMEAVDCLESVLKSDPRHIGANHYYIHVVEASKHPEWALVCAERLRTMMPASGHLLHMPSHIYILMGDYHKAALANEEAVAVDKDYIRKYGIRGIYPIHYLSHNLYFLSRAYSMEGNFEDAKRSADELAAFYNPHFEHMPDLEYYVPTPLFVSMRFHRWDEALNFPQPNPKMQVTNVLWHYGRAVSFASVGKLQEASNERRLFLEGQSKISPEERYGYNEAAKVVKIAEFLIDAKIAETQGDKDKAIDFYRKAVAAQDQLHYNEPPDWFFPVRESLGGLLLREKRYLEAENVFREDLSLHPRNGRSLYGLMESLKAQLKSHDLYWVEREFYQAWMYSDGPLSPSAL